MGRKQQWTVWMMVGLLWAPGAAAQLPQTSPVTVAQTTPTTITGQLDENSAILNDGSYFNIHTFTGNAGDQIQINLASDEFDAYLILVSPNGLWIAQDDDSGNNTNSHISYILPTSGTYQILANSYRAFETGQYILNWQIITTDTASVSSSSEGQLSRQPVAETSQPTTDFIPNSIDGQLTRGNSTFRDGSYFNIHTFEGTAGDAILLTMISNDFDASLMLVKPDGEILASYDGDGRDETPDVRFMLRLPDTGTYQVFATSYFPRETGAYRLSWRVLTEAEESEIPSWSLSYYSDRAEPEMLVESGLYLPAIFFAATITRTEEELDILTIQLGENHPEIAHKLHYLAEGYFIQGRHADAEYLLLKVLKIYRDLPEEYPDEIAGILRILGDIARINGQINEGIALHREAYEIREDAGIPLRTYEYDQTSLEQSLEQYVETVSEDAEQYELARQKGTLAKIYHRQGRYTEAESLYREAIDLWREIPFGKFSLAIDLNYLALLYQAQGRHSEANALYQEALNASDEHLSYGSIGNSHSDWVDGEVQDSAIHSRIFSTVPILYNLAGLYRLNGNISQAISTLRTGLALESQSFDFNFANLSETGRLSYILTLPKTLNYVLSLNLDAAPNSIEAAQLALTTLLSRKGRLLEAGARVHLNLASSRYVLT